MNILIVEDNEGIRKVLSARFASRGCTVREAASGEEGVRECSGEVGPDIVLTDFNLPGMNGAELAERICEICKARGRDIPVFFLMTGNIMVTEEEAGPRFIAIFRKPFSSGETARAILKMAQ